MMHEFNFMDFLGIVVLQYVPFLFALCFHEFAHGWVAKLKGDRTAEMMGRLTMNPVAHMDPIGTFLLPLGVLAGFIPAIFFGWAKPVPVNERNLRQPVKDMFWVAIAGPVSNLLLAFVGVTVYVFIKKYTDDRIAALPGMLESFIMVNLSLAFFNLLPIHPLDGGKVFARFLPRSANYWLEENQGTLNIVLIVLMATGMLRYLGIPIMWTANHMFNFINQVI